MAASEDSEISAGRVHYDEICNEMLPKSAWNWTNFQMFCLFKLENWLLECKCTKRTEVNYGFKVVRDYNSLNRRVGHYRRS